MKRRRIAGLLTAAALMLTSQPSMTANAIDDRLETGTKDGYNWELWLQDNQGSAKGEQGENGTFSCEWNSSLGFLYRSGHTFEDCIDWRNTERITVDYKASEFQTDGNAAYIGLHGWTKNAVAEFYIIDGYGTWSPALGGFKILGEVTSDDGTYEVFQREINGVTAEGKAALYNQIWSVRKGSRKEGTIDVTAHLRAWESFGLNVGNLFEVSLTVESYQSSGTAVFTQNDLKISTDAADPQPAVTTPAAVTGTAPQTTASAARSGDYSLRIGEVSCAPGGTVKVPVYVYNDPGIAGYQLFFQPEMHLKLNKIERGNAYRALPTINTDPEKCPYPSVVYAGSDTMQAEDGSVLCYLNVTVPAYAAEGTVFAVSFYRAGKDGCTLKLADIDGEKLDASFCDGHITVSGEPAVTTAAPGTTAATPSAVKCGDANGDNSIDLKDVTVMRRALAGWDVAVNDTAADINKDGSFDLKDVVILRRYLAGSWGVVL